MISTKVRLRVIFFGRAFRYTDVTHWDWAKTQPTFPKNGLSPGDCLLFISQSENQLLFLWQPTEHDDVERHGRRKIFRSVRLRVEGGTWHPMMIQEYANEVGLEFVGLKNFRAQYDEFRAQKRGEEHEKDDAAAAG